MNKKKNVHKLSHFLKKVHFLKPFSVKGLLVLTSLCILFVVASFVWVLFSVYTNPLPGKLHREVQNTSKNIVADVTELYPVTVKGIIVPHTTDDIVNAVQTYDHVSIGGGRNSMGGQTASERAVQIDMREFNKILAFSKENKEITVQSGARWRDIQDYIDPYNLSVKIMQTYSNFTVGGSLSVNVHGRYIGLGPIILSVKGFTIVLADGSIVHATPEEHSDIFYSAIGGMGGIGVITDVTLSLVDNVNVKRDPILVKTEDYYDYFKKSVRDNPKVIFHNGDMYPPDFDHVRAVSWVETSDAPTTETRLIPRGHDYFKERVAWVIMSEWPFGRWIWEHLIDPVLYAGTQPIHTRNYEASYDVVELEPEKRDNSSYVLQEYFVPVQSFSEWIPKMKKVFNDNNVNVINVSIRHALPDPGSKLAWARSESFAFVAYFKQGSDAKARAHVESWTKEMIDQVVSIGGAYYLPYQPHATEEQFLKAYPHAQEFFNIKKLYDPTDKFTNKLWDKYYKESPESKELLLKQKNDRPYDNAYLSIPEWFIVYNSTEYARALSVAKPSSFHYFDAIKEYWSEYRKVVSLTKGSSHDNSDYIMVLRIIGTSYSVEMFIKGLYENTFGRFFETLAHGQTVYEERIAARMNQDYASFIYDYPWYDFPSSSYFSLLWTHGDDTQLSVRIVMRKIERLALLTVEIGAKTIYSSVIAFATHQKFGVQDDIIYASVSEDGGTSKKIISAPHYQPFTRLLLDEMKSAIEDKKDFVIYDIAGNEKITLSFLAPMDYHTETKMKELMRKKESFFGEQGTSFSQDRIQGEVSVDDLFSLYKELSQKGYTIDHLYDY